MVDQPDLSTFPLKNFRIPLNPYLHAGGPQLPIEGLLALKRAGDFALPAGAGLKPEMLQNLALVSEEQIRAINAEFGGEGIFKLNMLALTTATREFENFLEIIRVDELFRDMNRTVPESSLSLDNEILKENPKLDEFCHNVINVSFSRKLFNPGVREGYLVYGLGGPRILISLPFRGASKFTYDVFENSLEVVLSLISRGFYGTFLLLDLLNGLNKRYYGQDGWLLWFSIIAAHSDLVIFVKESGKQLSNAQILESGFTPDRVPKKIVELDGELTFAKADQLDPLTPIMPILRGKGFVSLDEWEESERSMAEPFILGYERGPFPKNKTIIIHENGTLSEAPLINLRGN